MGFRGQVALQKFRGAHDRSGSKAAPSQPRLLRRLRTLFCASIRWSSRRTLLGLARRDRRGLGGGRRRGLGGRRGGLHCGRCRWGSSWATLASTSSSAWAGSIRPQPNWSSRDLCAERSLRSRSEFRGRRSDRARVPLDQQRGNAAHMRGGNRGAGGELVAGIGCRLQNVHARRRHRDMRPLIGLANSLSLSSVAVTAITCGSAGRIERRRIRAHIAGGCDQHHPLVVRLLHRQLQHRDRRARRSSY